MQKVGDTFFSFIGHSKRDPVSGRKKQLSRQSQGCGGRSREIKLPQKVCSEADLNKVRQEPTGTGGNYGREAGPVPGPRMGTGLVCWRQSWRATGLEPREGEKGDWMRLRRIKEIKIDGKET